MRAIGGQKKQINVLVFPLRLPVVDSLATVNGAIVEDDDYGFGVNLVDKMSQRLDHESTRQGLFTVINRQVVVQAEQAQQVEPFGGGAGG